MEIVIKEIKRVTGFEYLDLVEKDKSWPKCEARYMMMRSLRNYGYTMNKIGRLLNRDHTTILHGLKVHNNLYLHSPRYATKYDKLNLSTITEIQKKSK